MRFTALLATAFGMTALATDAGTGQEDEPPVEQPPADPKAARSYSSRDRATTGRANTSTSPAAGSHGSVEAELDVPPVLAIDWPKKAGTLDGAKAIVLLFDGGESTRC